MQLSQLPTSRSWPCRNPDLWNESTLTPAGKAFIQRTNLSSLLASVGSGPMLDCPLMVPNAPGCPPPAVGSIQVCPVPCLSGCTPLLVPPDACAASTTCGQAPDAGCFELGEPDACDAQPHSRRFSEWCCAIQPCLTTDPGAGPLLGQPAGFCRPRLHHQAIF